MFPNVKKATLVKYILFIFKKATFYIQNIEAWEFLAASVFYISETTRKINFQLKTYPCVFIGYRSLHKGYICLYPSTKRVHISHHVVFNENCFRYANPFVKENHLQIPIEIVSIIVNFGCMVWDSKNKSTKKSLGRRTQPTNQVDVSSKTWSAATTHVLLIMQLKSKLFRKIHPHKENNLVMKETYPPTIG